LAKTPQAESALTAKALQELLVVAGAKPGALRKIVFGSGIEKPMIAAGNSSPGECSSVMAGTWSLTWGYGQHRIPL